MRVCHASWASTEGRASNVRHAGSALGQTWCEGTVMRAWGSSWAQAEPRTSQYWPPNASWYEMPKCAFRLLWGSCGHAQLRLQLPAQAAPRWTQAVQIGPNLGPSWAQVGLCSAQLNAGQSRLRSGLSRPVFSSHPQLQPAAFHKIEVAPCRVTGIISHTSHYVDPFRKSSTPHWILSR